MTFDELNIHPKLLEKIHEVGFTEPTPIQDQAIPLISDGNDVVGQAETGSGKTLAFGLPVLEKIIPEMEEVQTLVLTPTRELCVQVTDVLKEFGKPLGVNTISIYGGVGIEPQIRALKTAHIVVGTPGRILDHLSRRTLDLAHVNFLILDEADKMFEMGFIDDVERIIRATSAKKRQTMMFSATISYDVQMVMKRHMHDQKVIKTQEYVDKSKLKQIFYDIYEQDSKFSLLVHLLQKETEGLAIVFCSTRREAGIVERNLKNNRINALAIHGGMTQNKRQESLEALKNQDINVLVATDVAARGLDIKNVTHVYNYDVPATPEEYVHRIGRTARAGEKGCAVTLLTQPDHDNFRRVQGDRDLSIERVDLPEFEKVPFRRRSPDDRYQQGGRPRRGGEPRRDGGRSRRPRSAGGGGNRGRAPSRR